MADNNNTKFKPGNKIGGRKKGSANKSTLINTAVTNVIKQIAAGEITVKTWQDIEDYVYTVLAYDGLNDKSPKVRLKVALALMPYLKSVKGSELQEAGAKGLQINLFAPQAPGNKYLEGKTEVRVIQPPKVETEVKNASG